MAKGWILSALADVELHEISDYTARRWGEGQAERYAKGLARIFDAIATGRVRRRVNPGLPGLFFTRYEHHYVFWKERDGHRPMIVRILHERMDLLAALKGRL